jgi:CheY-like chemotaxis protein
MAPACPVLVVEDDPESRFLLERLLAVRGYRTIIATNGEEGLAMARAHKPCLIVLDLMMPVLDGRGFRDAQRKDDAISGIPVVCVSGHHDAARIAQSIEAVACLRKPLVFDDLITLVARHCGDGTPQTSPRHP